MFDVRDAVNEILDLLKVMPFCGRKRKSSNVLPTQAGSNIDSFIVLYIISQLRVVGRTPFVVAIVSGLIQYSNIFRWDSNR